MRKKKNRIEALRDSDGVLQKDMNEMKSIITNYFTSLFTSTRPNFTGESFTMIDRRVTSEMNDCLDSPFTQDEIITALKHMKACKSPGLDGLPALFYKRFWSTVGGDISSLVLDVLNGAPMPTDLNFTHVALIPKVKKPEDMKDLRPISLCNVSYKLISKVLANRLKKILPLIIKENQSAFVPGRLITDNILLSSEVFHFMNHNKAKKRGYMTLKLDMSKAYDRIEWDFLQTIMEKLGFSQRWISCIMKCVSTTSYQFMINGDLTNTVFP